jgi:sugar lactone lactonase YvrE
MAHGPVSDTRVLLDGFGMGESPRWHEGRLWFSNWGTNEIVALDIEGNSEVVGGGHRPGSGAARRLAVRRQPATIRTVAGLLLGSARTTMGRYASWTRS